MKIKTENKNNIDAKEDVNKISCLSDKDTLLDSIVHYQAHAIRLAQTEFSFEDKIVLEVGGSNIPKDVVFKALKVKKWVCVDLISPYQISENPSHYKDIQICNINDENLSEIIEQNDYVVIKADASDINEKFYDKFDICISFCSFEHILTLNIVLSNIYKALKVGGYLFSMFGPLYSCFCGSHFYLDSNINFNKQDKILDFAHLLMSNAELIELLLTHYPQQTANELFKQIKTSERVNRFFYEDYEEFMKLSEFKNYKLTPTNKRFINKEILLKLQTKYPGCYNFDAYSAAIVAKKD